MFVFFCLTALFFQVCFLLFLSDIFFSFDLFQFFLSFDFVLWVRFYFGTIAQCLEIITDAIAGL